MIAYLVRLFLAAAMLARPGWTSFAEVGWLLSGNGENADAVWDVAMWLGTVAPADVPLYRLQQPSAARLADAHEGCMNALRLRIQPLER